MDKQIRLTLTGCQRDENNNETVTEQTADGEFYERNGSLDILYEEKPDNGERTTNRIKLKGSQLELLKKGSVNSCMVFEPGREHTADYATPFGLLRLGILTDSVELQQSEDQLEITVNYTLTESGRNISFCNLSIKIQNRGKFIGLTSRYK